MDMDLSFIERHTRCSGLHTVAKRLFNDKPVAAGTGLTVWRIAHTGAEMDMRIKQPHEFGLPLTGVESHAHLLGRHFRSDLRKVLERAQAAGISAIGNVCMGSDELEEGKALFADTPEVFFILGIHPTDSQTCTDEALARMEGQIRANPRIKAVGETGLDFYWKTCPPEIQHAAFRRHLTLAREYSLPVVIHSRDATEATFKVLLDEGFSGKPLLWHCFGGDSAAMRSIVDNGWHLSIPGPVTFPANAALREAAAAAPLDRLLIETDCPYLAPIPFRGKRNEPAYAVYTAQALAQSRGMDLAELWTAVGGNARKFFRL
jgi:TatD DNase family protein